MVVTADVVLTNLYDGVSQKSMKQYFVFEGVVVGCKDLPLLAGVSFKKFISKEVFEELSTLTCDRFDCSIGVSRVASNSRDCDIAFNMFINGFPKDDNLDGFEPVGSPDNFIPSEETLDKNSEKGGKK